MYDNSKDAKNAGWHSRRHQTQVDGGETRRERKIRLREEAEARQAERDQRTDEEQLKLLFARGHGDCNEALVLADRIKGLR